MLQAFFFFFFSFFNLYELYDFFSIIFIFGLRLTCFLVCMNFIIFLEIIFILDNILTLTCFLISAYFIDV